MAKRSEVALVIERLEQKKNRIAEDRDLLDRFVKNQGIADELKRQYEGVLSAITLLESERKAANGDKPKRERKKKNAATEPQL